MATTSSKRLVTCPQCKTLVEYRTDNPFRPFCSERCKMVDLGAWATENYRISEPILPDADLDLPTQ